MPSVREKSDTAIKEADEMKSKIKLMIVILAIFWMLVAVGSIGARIGDEDDWRVTVVPTVVVWPTYTSQPTATGEPDAPVEKVKAETLHLISPLASPTWSGPTNTPPAPPSLTPTWTPPAGALDSPLATPEG